MHTKRCWYLLCAQIYWWKAFPELNKGAFKFCLAQVFFSESATFGPSGGTVLPRWRAHALAAFVSADKSTFNHCENVPIGSVALAKAGIV